MGDAQDHERVGVGLLDQLLVRPGVDRPAALEVDVRAQDRRGSRRGSAGPSSTGEPGTAGAPTKNCSSCARERADRSPRKIGPASAAGRRPDSRYDWWNAANVGPSSTIACIELLDQALELLQRDELPGLAGARAPGSRPASTGRRSGGRRDE